MNKKNLVVISLVLILSALALFIYAKKGGDIVSVEPSTNTEDASNKNSAVKTYSVEEVAQHGLENDCWMIINAKVYNVTQFIPFHPGGKIIATGCGKDATVLFETRPTNLKTTHPDEAREQLDNYYLGDLQVQI